MVASLGVIALGVPLLVFHRDVLEGWQLRRFASADAATKADAALRLGKLRSARAVPAFLDAYGAADEGLRKTLVAASQAIGLQGVPLIVRTMATRGEKGYEMSRFAAQALTEMGPATPIGAQIGEPMLRERFAEALEEKGRYSEALDEYLWCYDHGEERSLGYGGVRLSFLLGYIAHLAKTYPPAADALGKRREAVEAKMLDEATRDHSIRNFIVGDRSARVAREFARINEALEDRDRSIEMLRKLKGKEKARVMRAQLIDELIDPLLARRDYATIVEAAGNVEGWLTENIENLRRLSIFGKREAASENDPLDDMARIVIARAGRYYQAFVGAGQTERASALARRLMDFSPTASTFEAFVRNAALAGGKEQARALIEEASKRLTPAEVERLRAIEADPSSPAAAGRAATSSPGTRPPSTAPR